MQLMLTKVINGMTTCIY